LPKFIGALTHQIVKAASLVEEVKTRRDEAVVSIKSNIDTAIGAVEVARAQVREVISNKEKARAAVINGLRRTEAIVAQKREVVGCAISEKLRQTEKVVSDKRDAVFGIVEARARVAKEATASRMAAVKAVVERVSQLVRSRCLSIDAQPHTRDAILKKIDNSLEAMVPSEDGETAPADRGFTVAGTARKASKKATQVALSKLRNLQPWAAERVSSFVHVDLVKYASTYLEQGASAAVAVQEVCPACCAASDHAQNLSSKVTAASSTVASVTKVCGA
jgi:hypothetical protein